MIQEEERQTAARSIHLPTLAAELAAKMAETSVRKIGTNLNLASGLKRKADSENRLEFDGIRTSLQARCSIS